MDDEPWMRQQAEILMRSTLAALASPETAEGMAAFTKNYHDALVAKGFSKEDAMRIVVAHGIPNLQGGR